MKASIIKELFYSIRNDQKTPDIPPTIKKKLDKICDLEKKLKNQLTPDQFELHENFVALLDEEYDFEIEFYFTEGFKLGLRIGVACFEDNA